MRLTSIVIGFALLFTTQFAAASTSASATYTSTKISSAFEGPGPDVPPIIINKPKPPAVGAFAMLAPEGPGPDVPPIIINKPKPPATGGFNEGAHREGEQVLPFLLA